MSFAHENCPKCGHTLESINLLRSECINSDCDLDSYRELREYYKENDLSPEDVRR